MVVYRKRPCRLGTRLGRSSLQRYIMKYFTVFVSLLISITICYASGSDASRAINRLIDEQLNGVEYSIENQPTHPNIDQIKSLRGSLLQLRSKTMLEKANWAIRILEKEVEAIENVFETDPEKRTEETIKVYRQKKADLEIIKEWYSKNQSKG